MDECKSLHAGSVGDSELNLMGCSDFYEAAEASLFAITTDGSRFEVTSASTFASNDASVIQLDGSLMTVGPGTI